MVVRSDQEAWPVSTAGSRKATTASEGATLVQACTQVAVGAGQGMLPQSSQWLQGSPTLLRALGGGLDDAAAAATVVKPPASTARQPRKAARVRRRFTRQLWDFERILPIAPQSQTREAGTMRWLQLPQLRGRARAIAGVYPPRA